VPHKNTNAIIAAKKARKAKRETGISAARH
jgi:hypothetical protein